MPRRIETFFSGGFYHIFNKTIDQKLVFTNKNFSQHFLKTLTYYRSSKSSLSFSEVRKLPREEQFKIDKMVSYQKYFLADVFTYCLMPTHFHLLAKQLVDNGLVRFISNTLNSFTRYFNLRSQRRGPIFLPQFRSERITNESQLVHVSRYIHLNPYSGGVVKEITKLKDYPWSSYGEYLDLKSPRKGGLTNTYEILETFGGVRKYYQKFVEDRSDFQKSLEDLKHLNKW